MARAKAGREGAAREDDRETGHLAVSAAEKVRELEAQVYRLTQANRQLAEREARLRAIFEAEPDGVALVAPDGTLLDLNPAAFSLLELDSLTQLRGLRLEDLAADPERVACRRLTERVFRGEAATVELEIVSLKGARRWVEAHATPLRAEDGRIAALVCVTRDVTARRAADQALREGEARWRGVFGSSLIGMAFWGLDGSIHDANDAFLKIIGYSRDDLIAGRVSWIEITVPEDRRLDEEGLRQLAETGVCEPFEKHYVRRDGTRVPVLVGGALLEGSDDRGVAFVQDITARREAEDRLRESEERFRNLAEHAPLSLWISDPAGKCVYANQHWYEFSGRQPHQTLGLAFLGAVHPDDVDEVTRAFREAAAEGRPYRVECRVRHHDGAYRHVIDAGAPRFGTGGELVGYVGLLVDIQDRKDAEEARRRLEAPLRQAQKMEALGTLAGGVAHDFNNILGTIIGNVQLAQEELVSDHPVQESLAEVAKAGARARELVQQILTFGRRQPDDRRVVDLREVVGESIRLLRATLPAGIELVTTIGPGVPNVLADRSRVHQVLMNLCANAWQAIDGPVGRIEVSLARVDVTETQGLAELKAGRYACLTVRDDGRGIAPDVVERIFDPFFTTKAPGEGTGLGLSVVDGIVKAHEGTIAVDTAPGQGSTFRVYFPAVDAPVPARVEEKRPQPSGAGQRVLYLDDEASLVHLASRLLGRLGYEVEGFTRPADALAAFAADPRRFDVVISDMNMPTASGLSVAAEILQRRPDLPVALISGFVTDELAARAEALGVRAVVYKPNLSRELGPLIGRLLG